MDLQAKSEWIKVWSSPKPWHSISVLSLEVHGLHIWPELWTPNCADLLKFCCLNQNQHLHQNRSFIFSQLPHACSPFLWRRSAGCGCPTQSGCCKFWDFMEAAAPSALRWIRSRLACVQNACKMGIRKRLVSAWMHNLHRSPCALLVDSKIFVRKLLLSLTQSIGTLS